jgi:dTDP-glucose 4,6-dehydratase
VSYEEAESFTTRVKTPDSSKAKRDLDFKLAVPVEEGMKKTVEWFKKLYGNKSSNA